MYTTFHLREFREKKGWSQRELAKVSGISQAHISEIEKKRSMPSLDTANRLTFALGLVLGEVVETHMTFMDVMRYFAADVQVGQRQTHSSFMETVRCFTAGAQTCVIEAEHLGSSASGEQHYTVLRRF